MSVIRVGPAPAGTNFRTGLLATDSVGKTTKKWFTPKVCEDRPGWVPPICGNGYSLDELITHVLQHPRIHDNQQHDTLCIISMGNKYIGLNLHTWHTKWSVKVHQAIRRLAEHIRRNGVKRHLILYGGDVEMFRGPQFSHPAMFPQDYADIQSHILDMLRHEGLNCGTGMEAANGGYGQFQGKLDPAMHIMGIHRAEAEQYMHKVLQKAEESATDMSDKDSGEWELVHDAYSAASEDESDWEDADVSPSSASSGSKRKVDQMPGSSGTPSPPWKRTASGQNDNTASGQNDNSHIYSPLFVGWERSPHRYSHLLATLQDNPEKQHWLQWGKRQTPPKQWGCHIDFLETLCPVNRRSGTVLVCTSGDDATKAQLQLCCEMLRSLGWSPVCIEGVKADDFPPKSACRYSCKATFAWYVSLMPKIMSVVNAMRPDECLMVAEDSLWPTDMLTPDTVYAELHRRGKALWLAALTCGRRTRPYKFQVGDYALEAHAAAGSKCFCGNSRFWSHVEKLFSTQPHDFPTDSMFQMMVAMEELALVYPFWGATMPHVSMRQGQARNHNLKETDYEGKLLPLPASYTRWIREEQFRNCLPQHV